MPSSGCQTSALRSEEHTSELQSHSHLVCRLLIVKKKVPLKVLFSAVAVAVAIAYQASRNFADFFPNFFFNNTATTEIYPLSLHDAFPIIDTATPEISTLSLHDALPISVVAVS